MAISEYQVSLVQQGRRVGHPALHIRMPVSNREQANTAQQQRPASSQSATANPTSITDSVASAHCTGMFTAVPVIQAALT